MKCRMGTVSWLGVIYVADFTSPAYQERGIKPGRTLEWGPPHIERGTKG